MSFVGIDGQALEYQFIAAHRSDRPTLVLLHEGLGSVALWRDFPARLAQATSCRTLIWSRLGHGDSAALVAPRTPRYLHEEALQRLPPLLRALAIERPVLVGHSDGGSIALLHAAARPDQVRGVVVLAPHECVEEKALLGIRLAGESYASTGSDWRRKLQKKRLPQPKQLGDAVRLVARLGGYLSRATDPPPGHQLMWYGYAQFQTLCEGFCLNDRGSG
jgi:pimeloyl-ACP methyl ester carboxylesterase